jgi:antitoxin StbD
LEGAVTNQIYSEVTASISELKKNPMAAVDSGEGFPIAVLNRNKPAFYCVPAEIYEAMLDRLDDQELVAIVKDRSAEPNIRVDLNEL